KRQLTDLLEARRSAVSASVVLEGLTPTAAGWRATGLEWFPRIPAHWRLVRNTQLFRERDDRGVADLPLLEVSIASGVEVREFADNRIERRAADLGTQKIARKGDIVFNKMRMWQGAVG